eukprot:scaffold20133_cov63-Phaeocystis_antarctica.AAC.1
MVISTMLETQPKAGGGGGGETREEVVLKIVLGLHEKLPVDYKPDAVREGIRKLGGAKPLNICLQQEVDRLQKVISLIRSSLASLKLAIAGTIVMSPDLADALDALFMTRVPPHIPHPYPHTYPPPGVDRGVAARGAEHGRVVHQRADARRAAHRVARARPTQCLLADGLLQPAGLPDGQPAGGVPRARQGELGPRRRGQPYRGAQDGERGGEEAARGGGLPAWPLPRRLPLGQGGQQAGRLGAQGALRAAARALRDRRARVRQEGRRRLQLHRAVLQEPQAHRPQLHLRRRPAHRGAAVEVGLARRVFAHDEGLTYGSVVGY